MLKKLLSLFLTLTLLLSLAAAAYAESEGPSEEAAVTAVEEAVEAPLSGSCGVGLSWQLAPNGDSPNPERTCYTLTISGAGAMEDYTYVDGVCQRPWSEYSYYITRIEAQSGVTRIGNYAFFDCGAYGYYNAGTAVRVSLPDSLTEIGSHAFYWCKLAELRIPAGVRGIGEYALGSTALTEAVLPEGLTEISGSLFMFCESLKSVTIPASVTSIGSNAFNDCVSLESVTIPASVTAIGSSAFNTCLNLREVTIPASVTSVGSAAFGNCSRLQSVTVLNPACRLFDYDPVEDEYSGFAALGNPGTAVIRGYPGSTAETYAGLRGHSFEPIETKNGMVTENGQTYIYKDGVRQTGLVSLNGKQYYASVKDGHVFMGVWVNAGGGKYYYCASDGHIMKGGRLTVAGKSYYVDKNGVRQTGVIQIGNLKFYFSVKDGHLMKGGLVTGPGGKQYYASAKDGHLMKGGWVNAGGGKRYLLDAEGVVIDRVIVVG